MKKLHKESVQKTAKKLGIPEKEVEQIVDLFFYYVRILLESWYEVQISKLGYWKINKTKHRKARARAQARELAMDLMSKWIRRGRVYRFRNYKEFNDCLHELGATANVTHKSLNRIYYKCLHKQSESSSTPKS